MWRGGSGQLPGSNANPCVGSVEDGPPPKVAYVPTYFPSGPCAYSPWLVPSGSSLALLLELLEKLTSIRLSDSARSRIQRRRPHQRQRRRSLGGRKECATVPSHQAKVPFSQPSSVVGPDRHHTHLHLSSPLSTLLSCHAVKRNKTVLSSCYPSSTQPHAPAHSYQNGLGIVYLRRSRRRYLPPAPSMEAGGSFHQVDAHLAVSVDPHGVVRHWMVSSSSRLCSKPSGNLAIPGHGFIALTVELYPLYTFVGQPTYL